MNIIPQKIFSYKPLLETLFNTLSIPAIIIVVGIGAFVLGRLSVIEEQKTPFSPSNIFAASAQPKEVGATNSIAPQPNSEPHNFVASKNGSIYYVPSCSGAKRIVDANKVWFATKEEAAAAGFTPASNCKGL